MLRPPDDPKAGSRNTESEEQSRTVSTQGGLDALSAGRDRTLTRSYGS